MPKISDDFLVIHRIFLCFCPSLWYLYCLKPDIPYIAFSWRDKPLFQNKKFFRYTFFTQFVLSHASDNTTSPNIGVTDTWAVPHLTFFWGDRPPVLPKSPPMRSCQTNPKMHKKVHPNAIEPPNSIQNSQSLKCLFWLSTCMFCNILPWMMAKGRRN